MNVLLFTLRRWQSDYSAPPGRTGELFRYNLEELQTHTDRLFYYLFLAQYPAAIALACVISPLAWAGGHSRIHPHVWLAILFGGMVTSFPLYLIRVRSGKPVHSTRGGGCANADGLVANSSQRWPH